MGTYRKKPVEIEALQLTKENLQEVLAFCGGWYEPGLGHSVYIETLEGLMRADLGDWVIRGVNGEFYPCKPDVFGKTYEAV